MKKFLTISLNTIATLILIIYGLNYLNTHLGNNVARDFIERIPSPDGKVDAVLIGEDAGVTASYDYVVYIVPHDANVNFETDNSSFSGYHLKNLKIFWIYPRQLTIQYDSGNIYNFSNYWTSKDIDNYQYKVELALLKSDMCNNKH